LPGSMSQDALVAILMDVAALALRLDKPLTARLMPIPGKDAGDETGFEFEYFANSRVMAPVPEPLSGLLAGDESIELQSLAERPWRAAHSVVEGPAARSGCRSCALLGALFLPEPEVVWQHVVRRADIQPEQILLVAGHRQ